ncbi:MAG TPA: efflux RND transporter periplasmic adaptor subunit, partial [Acetobacteraceae bacterium]|nr:efflux RND transporter periplasmic adaptor subunit [Acetobacteraceae bacterium]
EATDRVNIRARVTGFLQERVFREGEEVQAGDILYRIERAPFEAEVQRQRASVAAAEANVTNARIALERARDLLRTSAGTQARVDDAIAAERSATAQLLGTQAALRTAEINLGYTVIAAPITGQIGRSNFAVGNVVGPDAGNLATIVSQDPMRVSFAVSQRTALELRNRFEGRGGAEATRVRIRLTDGRVYPHTGRIEFIDNQIDRNTDTILIRALIPNPERRVNGQAAMGGRELVDGQFVTVYVEGAEPVLAIAIPRAAVLQDQQGSYVFVLDEQNRAQRRNIRLGRSQVETAIVEDGLQGGEQIVTEGIQRVRPGQPVNPAPASAPPPRPAPTPPAAPAAGRG